MKFMFSLVLGGSLAVLGIKQSLAATELQKLTGV
jgi:hypothetical protein